ncbi:MAG: TRAP transporter large permease [Synergistaceae bacterium]|nr:TRAP transporter large permease [Synergistaceae bacterium]
MSIGVFLVLCLVVFLLVGLPIAFSLGLTAVAYFFYTDNLRYLIVLAQRMFNGINSFELIAIPLFILAGDLMYEGKISQALVNLAKSLAGSVRGSMAIIATLACMFFGAVSGSGPATTSAISSVMAKGMKEDGYPPVFSACSVAAAGPLGSLIPPSITMVVYGVTTNTSVGELLLAGVWPGVVFGLCLMVYEFYICKKHNYGTILPFSLSNLVKNFVVSIPALLTPVIILGGIYSGIFTPTEAGGTAVFYALLVGMFWSRSIKIKDLPRILLTSGVAAATIIIIIGNVSCLSFVLTREQIPERLAAMAVESLSSPWQFLLVVNIIYIFAGMIENGSSAIVMLAPILHPIALKFGIDPVFFGAMTVANLAIGMVTPPMAASLYIAGRIFDVEIPDVIKGIMPFFYVMLVGLLIVCLTAPMVTWLPSVLM